jgi:hypothetical protein
MTGASSRKNRSKKRRRTSEGWCDELRTNSNDNYVILAIAVTQAVPHHLPAISKKQGWLLTIKEMSLL